VKNFLRENSIKVPKYVVIENNVIKYQEIKSLKFPVVLKVSSSKFTHKSDIGAVVLGIQNESSLFENLKKFMERFQNETYIVEEMIYGNLEMLAGLFKDANFGICIMIGIGGIYTEVYKDVSTRVIPVSRDEVYDMIYELRGRALLENYRGKKVNKDSFVDLILKLSKIGEEYGDYISGLDLNPVILDENNSIVVDAKMILA